MDRTEQAVVAYLRDSLAEVDGGVMLRSELVELLDANLAETPLGYLSPEDLEDITYTALAEDTPLVSAADGRVVDASSLLHDVGMTHRLTADEVANDRLELDPDLSLLAAAATADGGLHRPDGTPLALRTKRVLQGGVGGTTLLSHHLRGPDGWLAGWSAGDVVEVRAKDGFLELQPVDVTTLAPWPAESVDRLLAELDTAAEGEPVDEVPDDIEGLQVAGILDAWWDPDLVHLPFSELLAAADLVTSGHVAGRSESYSQLAALEEVIGLIARNPNLSTETMGVLSLIVGSYMSASAPAPDRATLRKLASDPDLVEVIHVELRRAELAGSADPQRPVAEYLAGLEAPSGKGACGLLALQAHDAVANRDYDRAEQLARRSASLDAGYWPAVDLLAELAADRGDLRLAVNLLQSVRFADDPELAAQRRRLAMQSPDVGRNDPCPCGSGRKFKQCHLGRTELPPAEQVTWLLDKARGFTMRTMGPVDAEALLGASDLAPEELAEGLHLLGLDVALFDGGWFEQFLVSRGPVLSDSERALGERWLHANRPGVYQVAAVTNSNLTLTDTRTGDDFVAARTGAFEEAARHNLVWCRLLPGFDGWWASGISRPVRVMEQERLQAAVDETDATARLAILIGTDDSRRPGVILDGDRQPYVDCRTLIDHGLTIDALGAALESDFQADQASDDEPGDDAPFPAWVQSDDGHSRATVTSMAQTVVVNTTSLERHRRTVELVVDLLRTAGGDPVIGFENLRPIARVRALDAEDELLASLFDDDEWPDDDEDEEWPDDDVDMSDSAMAEALDSYIRQYEEQWVDQSIPALGGHSPRAAAADPKLRPTLLALLAEFDRPDAPMSVTRIKALLNLAPD